MELKSYHQQQVEAFMLRIGTPQQQVPVVPTIPTAEVRKLRARLILEEAMETIAAMGLGVRMVVGELFVDVDCEDAQLEFFEEHTPDMVEIIDGCCDLRVVTTGTLSACGIPDIPFQRLVDENNLAKHGPGSSIREDGKLIKPPGHEPPEIERLLQIVSAGPKITILE